MAVGRATQRATLADVAKAAGVSVSTASVVLNAKNTTIAISKSTRARVLAAAEELRYEPNVLARAFVQQRSNTVGVVIGDPSGYVDAEKVRGVNAFLREKGYTLLTSASDDGTDIADQQVRAFLSRRIDGLIVMDAYRHIPDKCFLELADEGVPVVLVERDIDDLRVPTVHIADYDGTRLAMTHLLEHGHKRIGFIAGPAAAKPTRESLRAYRDVISAAGLEFDERYVVGGDWLSSSGYVGMERLLQQSPTVTAAIASNDAMALGAMRAIYGRGLSVPEDVAVVGFDNIPVVAPYSQPPLTTVNNPLFLVGRVSAELLHELIAGRKCPNNVVLPVDLVIRESCGCVSANRSPDCVEIQDGSQAAALPDRTRVEVSDHVVAAVWGHAIYIQNMQRTSGLCVSYQPVAGSTSLSPGDVVSVIGHLMTIEGRKTVGDPYLRVTGRTEPPAPRTAEISDFRANGRPGWSRALVEVSGTVVGSDDSAAYPAHFWLAGQQQNRVNVQPMETGYHPRIGDSLRVTGVLESRRGRGLSILAVRIRPT